MPAKTRFDPVQIARAGAVTAGLEGAAGTGAGSVLLWGWLFDADRELTGLRCEIAGRALAVELLDRTPRADVVEMLASAARSRSPEVGFLGLTQVQPEFLVAAGGRITLTVEAGGRSANSANRLVYAPGAAFQDLIGERLPLRLMRPEAIRRAGQALWAPEAARVLAEAQRHVQRQGFGPEGAPALSLVIPVGANAGVLRETLAYLDMDDARAGLELVLALQDDGDWAAVEAAVLAAAADLRILVVRTGETLPPGAAARIGLDAATAEAVVLMSDAVAPPVGGWIEETLADLAVGPFALPEAMPRFDGRTERFEPRTAPGSTAWPHEDVRTTLRARAAAAGLDRWSPGLVAGRRSRPGRHGPRLERACDGSGFLEPADRRGRAAGRRFDARGRALHRGAR
jgi:hypothetical protein